MNKLLKDIKKYFTESRTLIIVGVVLCVGTVFAINFMVSMPRTFFFVVGLTLGVGSRHFWTPIKTKAEEFVKGIPITSKFTDRNEDTHLNI